MNLYIFASFIILVLVVYRAIKKQNKIKNNSEKSFWEKERQANAVRRKSLDSLNYIRIPLDKLPMETMAEDSRIMEFHSVIHALSTQSIVNLTGYTNTELKLEYGTANITALSEYDQNYTVLVRTLQRWADTLYEADYIYEARVVMEFAISTGTDVSRTYYKLASIYASRGEKCQIQDLIDRAGELRTMNKQTIVRTLQESYL